MRILCILVLSLIGFGNHLFSQIFTAKSGSTIISFFSSAPLEDIEAQNKIASVIYKATTNEVQMRISIQTFKFKNALMEEHFNENYMESSKYPNAEFRGKINESFDQTKEQENKVTVTGILDMHGVKKEVTMNGTITKIGNEFKIESKFQVKVADYNIKVPSMYVKNIAEVVDVSFSSVLEPFQKK